MKKFSEYLESSSNETDSVNEKLAGVFDSKYYKLISAGVSDKIPGTDFIKYSGVPMIGIGDNDNPVIETSLKNVVLIGETKLSEKATTGMNCLQDLAFSDRYGPFNKEVNELMTNLDKGTREKLRKDHVKLYKEMNKEVMKETTDMVVKFNDYLTKKYQEILKSYEGELEGVMDALIEENKKVDPTLLNKVKKTLRWIGGRK